MISVRASAKIFHPIVVLLTLLLLGTQSNGLAFEAEKENSGWSFYFDNDELAFANQDRDYTGGAALKLSGTQAQKSFLSLDRWLAWLDEWVAFEQLSAEQPSFTTHSRELGFTLFTPEDQTSSEPKFDQHPYASLFFVSNTRMRVVPDELLSYQSTLRLGVLGLGLGGELQKALHKMISAESPKGWSNQISDGGEATFLYSVSRSKHYLFEPTRLGSLELKSSMEAAIGYSTDVGIELSLRLGRILSPWWSFNPNNAEYIGLGSPAVTVSPTKATESYAWLGVGVKYRLYNALLQGQFRESAVTFDRDQLVPVIAEMWLGYTHEFKSQWYLSGYFRVMTKEIDLLQAENPFWGGFIISRSF